MQRYWVPSSLDSALMGTDLADYWFPVAQGGDIAFIYGVLKVMIANGWGDSNFTKNFAEGWDELAVECEKRDWLELEKQAGLPRASMEEFGQMRADSDSRTLERASRR